jgi:hypothetical protein
MVEELGWDEKDFVRLYRPAIRIAKRIRSFTLLERTHIAGNVGSNREAGRLEDWGMKREECRTMEA